jgi:hypothetical protein
MLGGINVNDESLLDLKKQIAELENKDASYVSGFMSVFKIIENAYEAAGTDIQKCLLSYLKKELDEIYTVKSQHGRFNHVIK